jgi:hypothetical protein
MFASASRFTSVSSKTTERRRAHPRFRPGVQGLENRLVLSNYATVVSNADDSGPGTLRYDVMHAQSGEIIEFDPKFFTGGSASVINLKSPIVPAVSLTITGEYTKRGTAKSQAVDVTLSGGDATRIFMINSKESAITVTLQHLTITRGKATDSGDLTDTSHSAKGGGIFIDGRQATLRIIDCAITDNLAAGKPGAAGSNGDSAYGGGIYDHYGTVVIENSKIFNNDAFGGTGGLGVAASAIANGNGCDGGAAYGGGIAVSDGHLTLLGVRAPSGQAGQQPMVLAENTAQGGLGGFGTTVHNNSPAARGGNGGAAHGGGIYDQSASLTMNTATISDNHAIGGDGQIGALGCPGAPGGGTGGMGGGGGFGGAGTGGGLELDSVVKLTATDTTITKNDAKAGDGGMGGFGGLGGIIFPTGMFGPGGNGGDGGNSGSAFGGAIFTTGSALGTYTDGAITGNTVTAGKVGDGGMPTAGDPAGATGTDGQKGKVQNGAVSTTGGSKPPRPKIVKTKVEDNSP